MGSTKSRQRSDKSHLENAGKSSTDLSETELDGISGGPTRRMEDYGDHIGNYNLKSGTKLPGPEQWDPGEYSPSSN